MKRLRLHSAHALSLSLSLALRLAVSHSLSFILFLSIYRLEQVAYQLSLTHSLSLAGPLSLSLSLFPSPILFFNLCTDFDRLRATDTEANALRSFVKDVDATPRTQIHMNLSYIDPELRVLNYCLNLLKQSLLLMMYLGAFPPRIEGTCEILKMLKQTRHETDFFFVLLLRQMV